MGFFDKVFNTDAVMSGSAYWNIDSDAHKLRVCMEAGQRMAPAIGGTVKSRDGGDEVHVTGQYNQYSVRLIIWVSFGNLRLQVKPKRELPVPWSFNLQYDEEAGAHAHEQLDRDEWDADESQKLFLSPHLYFEADRDELRQIKTCWDQLPRELTDQLLLLMEETAKPGTHFQIGEQEVTLYLNDSAITLSKSADQRVAHVLHLLTSIVAAGERVWVGGDEQPFQAAPAPAPPAGPPPGVAALGPGSPVLVTWSDGNRYPATIVNEAQGQYLCAFPNGQQQWVAAPYVAAAR
ncbi:MAG: hypothetical protein KF718_03545 [Polyangiaceae bacterium]|nr:hypothetical protein [Polyangiaceae bacterium]